MAEDERFDVVVAGGGMTGGLLAAALAREPTLSVCVLEADPPAPFEPGSAPPYDIRVSALSIATERMFRRVGAWDGVVSRRACPYREMMVWDGVAGSDTEDPARGRTHFDAAELGAEALGYIVENRVVQLALLERLEHAPNVTLKSPARLESFRTQAEGSVVALEGGGTLRTRLLVGADGAGSAVRSLANIAHEREPYSQHALVATVRTVLPQRSVTWQRFVPSGPQAFLPLCGPHASMVWYHEPDEIRRLTALEDERFVRAM